MSRIEYWGDCDDFEGCGAQVVVSPNPESVKPLPSYKGWDSIGWPECPVCGGPASFGGSQMATA